MNSRLKRILWYSGAIFLIGALYIFLNAALQVAWLSAFTHANVLRLRIYFIIYCMLLILSGVGIVFCIKRGNSLKKSP